MSSDETTQRRPNTAELLPFDDYDWIVVQFSGGKDSTACALLVLDEIVRRRGFPRSRVLLWHQAIDGGPEDDRFFDWPCTEAYCKAFADAMGLRLMLQYKMGGFRGEMLREESLTQPTRFELIDGGWSQVGGKRGKLATRRMFPQVSADLSVRWCSSYLKKDPSARAINNDPAFRKAKILSITGERAEESANRARYAEIEAWASCSNANRTVHQWRPILDWPEKRVWEIIERFRVRPHPAYLLGWSRLSCMTCIFGSPDQWATVRRTSPRLFEEIADYEREFGATIQRKESVERLADRGEPFEAAVDRAELLELALSERYPVDQVILAPDEAWTTPAGAFKHQGGPT